MRSKILIILVIIDFFLHNTNCFISFDRLSESERNRISDIIKYKLARFILAERVDSQNPNKISEISIRDLFDTKEDFFEFYEIREYVLKMYESVLPDHVRSEKCVQEGDKCLSNVYFKYVDDQSRLFSQEFLSYLSSGFVQRWPTYYSDPNNHTSPIQVLPEIISFQHQSSTMEFDDF